MEKQFVTYSIASKLKELGFDKECFAYFNTTSVAPSELQFPEYGGETDNWNQTKHIVSAPLWQQVIEWFKDTYKIWIDISTSVIRFHDENGHLLPIKFQFLIEDLIDRDSDYLFHSADSDLFFEEHYDARKQAILSAIEILKNRKDVKS